MNIRTLIGAVLSCSQCSRGSEAAAEVFCGAEGFAIRAVAVLPAMTVVSRKLIATRNVDRARSFLYVSVMINPVARCENPRCFAQVYPGAGEAAWKKSGVHRRPCCSWRQVTFPPALLPDALMRLAFIPDVRLTSPLEDARLRELTQSAGHLH